MTKWTARWFAFVVLLTPFTSAHAQRVTPSRFAAVVEPSATVAGSSADHPFERLARSPENCRIGQGLAIVMGAVAGAAAGWVAYHFLALGILASDGPSQREAVRTYMGVGAVVGGVYSMYQWHRQCA